MKTAEKKAKLKLKQGDKVVVIAGKNKGETGKILKIDRSKMRVIVEKVNLQTKHLKPRQNDKPGERIQQEGPIHYSNVMLYNDSEKRGERVGYIFKGDSKVRILKKSKKEV